MKILNLYAGIGGNRKLWGDEHEITAVEIDPEIAAIYQDFFPNDEVIVGDAHQYLLEHFKEYDFIWSNFDIEPIEVESDFSIKGSKRECFDISKKKCKHRKDQIMRNCFEPKLAEHILNEA